MTRSQSVEAAQRRKHRVTRANLRLHGLLVVGVPGCAAAGWFELTRALAGRTIAWVYAFEWPLFGIVGVYMWWRLWHEQQQPPLPPSPGSDTEAIAKGDARAQPASLAPGRETSRPGSSDPGLAAWEQYLSELHSVDPPGKPPERNR